MYDDQRPAQDEADTLQFAGSDDEGSEFDASDSNLPFPKPISRSAFLAPDFDAATFLASLSDRHQTLEDLRTELRDLSTSLNRELIDLVNSNYQGFLSLGTTLRGGEEKVEEVRVGLLGFQRDLSVVRDKVGKRQRDVAELLEEKRALQQQISRGQKLLRISDRITGLEEKLMIGSENSKSVKPIDAIQTLQESSDSEEAQADYDSFDESSGEDDVGETALYLRKCRHRIEQYLVITSLIQGVGEENPYLASERGRIEQIRSTLILDLGNALKQARDSNGSEEQEKLILDMYKMLGETVQ